MIMCVLICKYNFILGTSIRHKNLTSFDFSMFNIQNFILHTSFNIEFVSMRSIRIEYYCNRTEYTSLQACGGE